MRIKKVRKEVEYMNKYKLSADPTNIILQEKQIVTGEGKRPLTKSKVGDINWLNIAYFANPHTALKYIIEKEIRESWVEDLKELSEKVSQLEKAIHDLSLDLSPDNLQ